MPCFTPGTLIATPGGEVPVERLQVGDKVITRDHGIQDITWTGRRSLAWGDLVAHPHLKPVLVKSASLGKGLPDRDLVVSPNHRFLVSSDQTVLQFAEREVLVAAKNLLNGAQVQALETDGVTYAHFMCARHEVVLSNGAWTESFQPGDQSLKGMGNAQRLELLELFPELRIAESAQAKSAARRMLKRSDASVAQK